MRTANVLAAVAVCLWVGVAMVGRSLIDGVIDQRALGYPNLAQIDWSIVSPAFIALGVSTVAWICNWVRRWPVFLGAIAVVALIALLPFLAFSGGGV